MVCLFINLFLSFLKFLFNLFFTYLFKRFLKGNKYFEGTKQFGKLINLEARLECFILF